MCGIVGYVGQQEAAPILLDGLRRLEYRGYDSALIFAPAMYGDIEYDLEDRRYTPLQTTYRFGQNEGRENHVNRDWTRVNYNSDFTITVE